MTIMAIVFGCFFSFLLLLLLILVRPKTHFHCAGESSGLLLITVRNFNDQHALTCFNMVMHVVATAALAASEKDNWSKRDNPE